MNEISLNTFHYEFATMKLVRNNKNIWGEIFAFFNRRPIKWKFCECL